MKENDNILNKIVEFCNHKDFKSARMNAQVQPRETDLSNWIQTSCSFILESVIPRNFWKLHGMQEPKKVDHFVEPPKSLSETVLMLALWSSWSQECSQHITQCLQWGKNIWKSPTSNMVLSYARCIALNLHASTCLLGRHSNANSLGKLYLQSMCLRQVIHSCSRLYQVMERLESADKVVISFADDIKNNRICPKSLHPISNVTSSTKDHSGKFHIVLIFEWFKRCYMLPQLHAILELKPVIKLIKEIERDIKKEVETGEKVVLKALEVHVRKAAHALEISLKDGNDAGYMACFVMVAHQWSKVILWSPMTEKKDLLILQSLVPVLVPKVPVQNCADQMKRILKQTPPIIPEDLFKELVTNRFSLSEELWCAHLNFKLNEVNKTISHPKIKTSPKERNSTHHDVMKTQPLSYGMCTRLSEKKTQSMDGKKENLPPKKRLSQKHVTFSNSCIERKLADEFLDTNLQKKRRKIIRERK